MKIDEFKYGTAGIYRIFCKSNSMNYIGSSCNIRRRLSSHIRDLNNNKHINTRLQNSWNKYGEDSFCVYLLEGSADNSNLINREKAWIDKYLHEDGSLFNMELDPSDKSGKNNSFFGRRHLKSTKIKLSNSHRKISISQLRSILTLINSGVVKSRDIANKFDVSESTISEIKAKNRKYLDVEERKCVIVTGSQGFLGGYIVEELLSKDYFVFGIDNFSKYGNLSRKHDSSDNFYLIEMDISKNRIPVIKNAKSIIAGAARIGGISYFSKYPRHIMRDNELILANTFDTALKLYEEFSLKRLAVISSSMVFEGADTYDAFTIPSLFNKALKPWPSSEQMVEYFPPPKSVYGFQKLASEFWAKAYYEQDGLPYTIVRPFNCVGVGEEDAIGDEAVMSGNVKLMMSHVLPDLVNKCLQGQDPLHILGDGNQIRCYTHGRDIARGIVMAMESDNGLNNDFNISTARPTTVLELAKLVWKEVNGDKPFSYISDEPFLYDVQKRIPDVSKAKELLGFEAEISLEDSVREVVEHMKNGNY